MFFAQVELRGGLPFEVTTEQKTLIPAEDQGEIWNQQLGEY
jgi:antitoxin component of RelBE/YafQ-DinJ toxin-antitoxin module